MSVTSSLMLVSQATEGMTYSIVRPTAFFKSIAGQVTSVIYLPYALHLVIYRQCSGARYQCQNVSCCIPPVFILRNSTELVRPQSGHHAPQQLRHAQVEMVKSGKPYIMFGDGTLAACKPISETDLAAFIADCVQSADRVNKILPIGGDLLHSCQAFHPRCCGNKRPGRLTIGTVLWSGVQSQRNSYGVVVLLPFRMPLMPYSSTTFAATTFIAHACYR